MKKAFEKGDAMVKGFSVILASFFLVSGAAYAKDRKTPVAKGSSQTVAKQQQSPQVGFKLSLQTPIQGQDGNFMSGAKRDSLKKGFQMLDDGWGRDTCFPWWMCGHCDPTEPGCGGPDNRY